ncbi:MAG: histidinol dehydrogenase [Rhodoluna sp.]
MSVIRQLDLRGLPVVEAQLAEQIPRAKLNIDAAMEVATGVINSVRTSGVSYIRELSKELDGFDPEPLRVSSEELNQALHALDPDLRAAIEAAIDRNRIVSQAAVPEAFGVELSKGASVSQRYVPVDSVGLYVPGGKAVYPSSVVMNAVPAQVAGVSKIFLATPGQRDFDGRPHPSVLATAALLGLEDVFCIGGPAAIAAFAYGIEEIDLPAVRLITGPGNAYVAAAKRLVRSTVAIDSEAGTTEILIIADEFANPKLVAADLISQAEHDESAAAVLVTDSEILLAKVLLELETQVLATKHSRRVAAALGGQQSALVLVDSLDQAVEVANSYATEHLEILVSEPNVLLPKITNAGAIFLGEYSPVSLGDYLAGSNHVLPTGGTAKYSSGLGVHTFLRPQQIIDYSRAALEEQAGSLPLFANAEDLPAHGEAVLKRFES